MLSEMKPLRDLFPDRVKCLDGRLGCLVCADVLFHPHHVVPAIEFIAALVELANQPIPQSLVKRHAVIGQIGIGSFT